MSLLNQPVRLIVIALISLSILLLLRLQTLQERTKRFEQAYAQARTAADQRQQVIEHLQRQISTLDEQQRQSDEAQAETERLSTNRLSALRKLEDENATLRLWTTGIIPVELGRLRDRDALTGASAYRERLRDAKTVHTASQTPSH